MFDRSGAFGYGLKQLLIHFYITYTHFGNKVLGYIRAWSGGIVLSSRLKSKFEVNNSILQKKTVKTRLLSSSAKYKMS